MIKVILDFFKNKGFIIVQDDITTIITAVEKESRTIITHTVSGRTMIAVETDQDIRFAGKIENLNQLKTILRLIKDLPVK